MGRLIDANRLKEVFSRNVAGGNAYFDLIDNAPTVEAIPIDQINKAIEKIVSYEGDCRLSVDEYPSCKQCTDNVFESIYAILDKCKAESEKTI